MMRKSLFLLVSAVVVSLGFWGCDSSSSSATSSNSSSSSDTTWNSSVTYGSLTDSRDGQTYKTVTIGSQTWMAQNLNCAVDSSLCYDDSAANCTKYGRLYRWAGAMAIDTSYNSRLWQGSDSAQHQGVCPNGWHIPTDTEWGVLIAKVGGDSARIRLSSTSGWDSANGTDQYGFRVLPAGFCDLSGVFFYGLGIDASFWSSSEGSASVAWIRDFHNANASVDRYNEHKSIGLPVRCLKD
jgi:uncharacterized protein (TIGR02145 family)